MFLMQVIKNVCMNEKCNKILHKIVSSLFIKQIFCDVRQKKTQPSYMFMCIKCVYHVYIDIYAYIHKISCRYSRVYKYVSTHFFLAS